MEKKQNAQNDKMEKTSKAMFTEMCKTNEKMNETNNELKEMIAKMTTMATQGWMLQTVSELLSMTQHIKSLFNIQSDIGLHHNDAMCLDRDNNKRSNTGIDCGDYDDYDVDKENYGLGGGNQIKCKFNKSDYFGNNNP
jgi:hypothetical protein